MLPRCLYPIEIAANANHLRPQTSDQILPNEFIRRQAGKRQIERSNEKDIDADFFNKLDLLLERGDHAWSPIRCQKTNRMGRKRHGNRLHAQFARPLHHRRQNLAVT